MLAGLRPNLFRHCNNHNRYSDPNSNSPEKQKGLTTCSNSRQAVATTGEAPRVGRWISLAYALYLIWMLSFI